MPEVILVHCTTYSRKEVEAAVRRVFSLAGGLDRYVRPGMRVLVKPNLLAGEAPEKGITTHPQVVRAVLSELLRVGAHPLVGDSPGIGSLRKVAEKTGVAGICRELGIPLAGFKEATEVEADLSAGTIKHFPLARDLVEVDAVINLPRMKTHGLTRISGAVKNLYGCIEGLHKAEFHLRLQRLDAFLEMLIDLALTVKPVFHLVDAVTAMEGAGPRHGRLRPVNLLMAGVDPFALDTVTARVMGVKPHDIPLLALAAKRGLKGAMPEEITVAGEELENFIIPDYEVPEDAAPLAIRKFPDWAVSFVRKQVTFRPVIGDNCRGCGICIRSCPAGSIHRHGKRAVIDLSTCIRCYCCQEFCPYNAVELKAPFLRKLLGGKGNTAKSGGHK